MSEYKDIIRIIPVSDNEVRIVINGKEMNTKFDSIEEVKEFISILKNASVFIDNNVVINNKLV